MTRATKASISSSRQKVQEERASLEGTRNYGAHTSGAVYHKTGLKKSAYKAAEYQQ